MLVRSYILFINTNMQYIIFFSFLLGNEYTQSHNSMQSMQSKLTLWCKGKMYDVKKNIGKTET